MDLLTPTLPWMHALHVVALQPVALVFSALGSEPFYLLLLPLIYWLVDRRIGAQLGILLLFSVLVNDLAKVALHLPRPFWVDPSLTPLSHLALEHSFGFPSGHSQGAFLVWPFLARRFGKGSTWMLGAYALASCIALSRLVLGVHWPLDVAGGILLGSAILWSFELGGWKLERRFRAWPLSVECAVVTLGIALLGVLGWLFIRQSLRDWDASYPSLFFGAFAGAPPSLVGRCAALLGLLIGLILTPRGEPMRRSVVGVLLGFLGLGVFYFGLKGDPRALPLGFVRYFLTTFWVACAAPWVFRRLPGVRVE